MALGINSTQEIGTKILSFLAKYAPEYNSGDFGDTFNQAFFVEIMNRSIEKRYYPLIVSEKTIAYEFARIANELRISEEDMISFLFEVYRPCAHQIHNYIWIFNSSPGTLFH